MERKGGKTSRSISRVLSWTIIHLRQVSPPACSDLPESAAGRSWRIPIWSCSGWGLPSPRLLPAARCALTAPFHPYPRGGGILSVALSVGSRPPGVTWHPALWSPDFPPPRRRIPGTRQRGSGRLTDSAPRVLLTHASGKGRCPAPLQVSRLSP